MSTFPSADYPCEYLRQIHPHFLPTDVPQSCAFQPTPKDNGQLSGSDGTEVTPEESFRHHVEKLGRASPAVFGLSASECNAENLPIIPSADEISPHHVHLDFSSFTRGQKEKASKRLRDAAVRRGLLYSPQG